jgi:multiple sugar transport system substrate-binding protein/sn-glycerol 3-phosphate transport system substrate-binding protein
VQRSLAGVVTWFSAAALLAAACSPSAAPATPASSSTSAPSSSAPAAQPSAAPAAAANPVDSVVLDKSKPTEIVFWHQNSAGWGDLSDKMISEFNSTNPYGITVKTEFLQDYTKIYQKVMAGIQANDLPNLAAGYESMASDYYNAKANIPFDDYMSSTKYGLSSDDMKDFVPAYMDATKFDQFGGKRLTFPYTKSALLLYTNMDNLKKIGATKPAATWDEFLDQCRKAVAAGIQCYALSVDASTADAFVFSYGGDVISKDGKTAWDSPEALKALKLYETMAKEKLAYQIQGSDDRTDLGNGKALYMIRTSTSIPSLLQLVKGDTSKVMVSQIPQGQTTKPETVLFGGNFIMFKSTPEKQLASWLFVKWWADKAQVVRWGFNQNGGYFPLRQSAISDPAAKPYLDSNPLFAQAIEVSKAGKVEPSNSGWQDVRNYIADGVTALITGKETAEQVQKDIMDKSKKSLAP